MYVRRECLVVLGFGPTVDIVCGSDGCLTERVECQPILIPVNDAEFIGKKCLEFVRSQPVPNLNCTVGKNSSLNSTLL